MKRRSRKFSGFSAYVHRKRATIKVSRETLEELKSLKKHPRETMESVIIRLIKHYRGENHEAIIIS